MRLLYKVNVREHTKKQIVYSIKNHETKGFGQSKNLTNHVQS